MRVARDGIQRTLWETVGGQPQAPLALRLRATALLVEKERITKRATLEWLLHYKTGAFTA